ncbi:transposase [Yersinia enterocolitica]|jgi:predicted transposase YdaD|uniref:Transposase n=1 Tax=Yersinia pekkanenii TaxID=1288385 RepID=A0A0T9RST8_9GAMM|nr:MULTISPECIES: hypothetical protein [Yersinia]AJI82638.1 hypothetical protein CH47_1208 [Yersinia enterocolitica]AJJ25251.1 hypothetical protein CH49_1084 [Yersinia enterocolitica]EKA27571.1 hypothetical protein YWA314_08589 [Yersinia enterocolitica subsp. enterocolitica WA-314]ELI8285048.1 Rpn family recombination-promoting nuclease/putative transposase [Yersinia enterocolitica]KGA71371.1 hypothetical protein DJ59_768 [Yersinia enterocolitica]
MTIAESLELEGYLKGYTESYQESQRETILKIARSLLAEGVDRTLVKEVTGLRDEDLTQ